MSSRIPHLSSPGASLTSSPSHLAPLFQIKINNSLGRNEGIEEIKCHPWMRNVDFDALRQQPAPYLPQESAEIKALMDYLKSSGAAATIDEAMIQKLTANFDDFADDDSMTKNALGCFGGLPQSAPPTRQEFIGYTFKRKKDPAARQSLAGAFDTN